MKVRAIQVGYFDHILRRVGDEFVIQEEKQFSKRWMERLDSPVPVAAPVPVSTAKPKGGQKKKEPVPTGNEDVI